MPLQTYKGYTVDYRLNQFRRVRKDGRIEFIEFRSDEGDVLLSKMMEQGLVPSRAWEFIQL